VEIFEAVVPIDAILGRFDAARTMAARQAAATVPLSPHHRLHGVAVRTELEELSGNWEAVRDLTPLIEATVEENLLTPCVRNERSLLVAAVASRVFGDTAESARLEHKAESLGMEGYDFILSGPRLRLALLKDDLGAVDRLVSSLANVRGRKHAYWLGMSGQAARLEGLVRLGDRAAAEEAALRLLEGKGTYFEPFALRVLGQVRGDWSLIERALGRFEEMRFPWYAEETRKLLTA